MTKKNAPTNKRQKQQTEKNKSSETIRRVVKQGQ